MTQNEGLGGCTLQEVVAFLDGSAPLDGVWFGEPHPTERGQFWWRKHLHAAAERVPLTIPQVCDLVSDADLDWQKGWGGDPWEVNRFLRFARAIEAAHGIKPLNAEVTGQGGHT